MGNGHSGRCAGNIKYLVALLALALPAIAAAAQGPRIQFLQLAEFVPAGQPVPPPGAFEQEYAKALKAPKPTPPSKAEAVAQMAAITTANSLEQRLSGMLTGKLFGFIGHALSNLNPIAGMAGNMLASSAEGAIDSKAQQAANAQMRSNMTMMNRHNLQRALGPRLIRISVWNNRLRVDSLTDGTAVIYRPDLHRYYLLDTAHKTYKSLPEGPAKAPIKYMCNRKVVESDKLGAVRVAGIDTVGYKTVYGMSAGDMPGGGDMPFDMQAVMTDYIANVDFPYAMFSRAENVGVCPPDSPALQTQRPIDKLAVYSTVRSEVKLKPGAPPQMAAMLSSMRSMQFTSVMWHAHLRTLGAADEKLFEVPKGYKQVN